MRCKQRRSRKQEGFTILEIVIATFVLTLAIGTSLTVLGRGFASLDSARCFSTASQIMQSELEKMRLTQWGNGTTVGTGTSGVTAYPAGPTPLTINTNFFALGSAGTRMSLTRTVADVHPGMLKITLTIEWDSHDGQALSRSYSTYYGKNGLYDFFSI
jgi:hypothetical protein